MAHFNVGFQPEPTVNQQSENKEEATSTEPSSLDCDICFTPFDRVFKQPKKLSCDHIFCLECLAHINVSSEDVNAITCPVCRALTNLPSHKGLPGLPTPNELLEQILPVPVPPGSIRFDRRRGLLYLPGGGKGGVRFGSKPATNTPSLSVDVGRPAPRGPGQLLRFSGWPFYVALAVALLVTIALIICGIYIFLMPSMYVSFGHPHTNYSSGLLGNHSSTQRSTVGPKRDETGLLSNV